MFRWIFFHIFSILELCLDSKLVESFFTWENTNECFMFLNFFYKHSVHSGAYLMCTVNIALILKSIDVYLTQGISIFSIESKQKWEEESKIKWHTSFLHSIFNFQFEFTLTCLKKNRRNIHMQELYDQLGSSRLTATQQLNKERESVF